MEPEVLEFLKRVAKSIGIVLLWLAINTVAAIKGDHGFIKESITTGNLVFYVWVIISVVLLVYLLRRLWNKPV